MHKNGISHDYYENTRNKDRRNNDYNERYILTPIAVNIGNYSTP
jgi:hypothetical protein